MIVTKIFMKTIENFQRMLYNKSTILKLLFFKIDWEDNFNEKSI